MYVGEMNRLRTTFRVSFWKFLSKEIVLLILIFVVLSKLPDVQGSYYGLLLFPVMYFKPNIKFYIDQNFILILIFSVLYSVFSTVNGFNETAKGYIVFYAIYPPLFYIIGSYLMQQWSSQRYVLFLFLISSFALPTIIITFQDILISGFVSPSRRLEGINNINLSATLRGANVSLAIAVIAVIFSPVKNSKERWYQIVFVTMGLLGLITALHLVNRTAIVIIVVTIALVVIKNLSTYNFKSLFYVIIFLSIVVGAVLYPLIKNSVVIEAYMNRVDDDQSNNLNAGGRTQQWGKGIDALFDQSKGGGGYKYGVRDYAHNFWLDVNEVAGIFPFLVLLILTVINFKSNFFLIKSPYIKSKFLVSLIIVLNVGFFLTCFVEPIMEANFFYVCGYFCFWGMTNIVYQNINRKNCTNITGRGTSMQKFKSKLRSNSGEYKQDKLNLF